MIPSSRSPSPQPDALDLDAERVLDASGALIDRFQRRRRYYRRWRLRAEGLLSELNGSAAHQRIDERAAIDAKRPLVIVPSFRPSWSRTDPSAGLATLYQTTGETRLFLR